MNSPSLEIGPTNFMGIMNQVHYVNNQLNLSFQSILLHVVDNFMIWCPYLQLHNQRANYNS